MAERRMFAKTVIDSDAFLDMALSTQALYFHLSMRADDDGFINNPKKLCRMIGSSDDEMKVLFAKKFLLGFESGVIVIKHWKMHNYIQKDRYKETNYLDEKAKLGTTKNNGYTLDTECIQDVSTGKDRLGKSKVSIELVKDTLTKKKPSLKIQIEEKLSEYQNINLEAFNEWIEYKKYKSITPITKLLNMLTKQDHYVQQEMVDNSIMNNYAGLFEPKGKQQHQQHHQSYTPVNGVTASQMIDIMAEEEERKQNANRIS